MAASNKRKSTSIQSKIKKIDSYFKPVHSETPDPDSSCFKKVKLQTRTLLKHKLVSNESDNGEEKEEHTIVNSEEEKEENHVKEEKDEKQQENQGNKTDKKTKQKTMKKKEEKEEKSLIQNKEDTTDKQEPDKDKSDEKEQETSSLQPLQITITETQELDTQNVPIFNTQTQTQNDTLGSPITYTFAEDEVEDSLFDLPKFTNTQTNDNKEKKSKKEKEEEEDGFIFSSTQESSLDDFDDIFNNDDRQHVNIASLDFSLPEETNNDIKLSSNLPDTNLSFPSSTL